MPAVPERSRGIESPYAWFRLVVTTLISTVGGVGMWSLVVALPAVQSEFAIARGEASSPYAFTMIGFMIGSLLMGWATDRWGVMRPVMAGATAMGISYVGAAYAPGIGAFGLVYGIIGLLGTAAMFSPLVADASLWFDRRRGMAIGICASGNYLAGAIWPPIIEPLIADLGWRQTHMIVGGFIVVTIVPLTLLLRRRAPTVTAAADGTHRVEPAAPARPLGLSRNTLQLLLGVAGVGCCIAMSMPQVHLVAYCVDLGYGPARGAEMLSVLLFFGIVSRLSFGWLSDRIGGPMTLLVGAIGQGLALALYLPFDGLMSLYVVSALFGLSQGGIVPSYAAIVRELFPAREAALRVGIAISATLAGMAIGGWGSGAIYDLTGSYQAAFVHGLAWNLVTITIALTFCLRQRRLAALAA